MKSILITQGQLSVFSGSEMITLELIEYFVRQNYNVTLLTHYYDNPAKKYIDDLGVDVILTNTTDASKLSTKDFDIIWVQHYTLTPSLIEQLSETQGATVIFNHMSAWHPLETIMFPDAEISIANKILFNSQETMDDMLKQLKIPAHESMQVLGNPAPDEFFLHNKKTHSKKLKKIAIVSNHIPDEVMEASSILQAKGVRVDLIGRGKDSEAVRMSPHVLAEYDAIVSIGKTVQYAIAMGVPIFCYDWFGGPGYLNPSNYSKALYHNFSGRGFESMSGVEIANQLVQGYKNGYESIQLIHDEHAEGFRLSSRLMEVLAPKGSAAENTEQEMGTMRKYSELLTLLLPTYAAFINKHVAELNDLKAKNRKITAELNNLNHNIARVQDDAKYYRERYFEVAGSRSYIVGRSLFAPMRWARHIARNIKRRTVEYMRLKRLKSTISKAYKAKTWSISKRQKVALVVRGAGHPTSSAFIRLISPLASDHLADKVSFVLVDGDESELGDRNIDIVIVQRTAIAHLDDAKRIVERVRNANAKLFVDTDDAFSELDKNHPQYALQKERVDALDYIIEHADETWVSTGRLRKLHTNAKRCRVVRNTIDDKVWTRLRDNAVVVPQKDEPLHILYMGTRTHDKDFEVIEPALSRLHQEFPGKFKFHIVGVAADNRKYPWLVEHAPTDSLYPRFVNWFNTLPAMDIGVSPLEDTAFNSNKSDIKCLDYLGLGLKPVVSDVEAYKNPELDDHITRVKNTAEDWYAVFEQAIKNKEQIRKDAPKRINKGYEYIRSKRLPRTAAKEIAEAIGMTST